MKRFVSMISCLSIALLLVTAGCKPQTGTPDSGNDQANFGQSVADLETKLDAFNDAQEKWLEGQKEKIPEDLYNKQAKALSTLKTLGDDAIAKCKEAISNPNMEDSEKAKLLKSIVSPDYIQAYREFSQTQKEICDNQDVEEPPKEEKKFNWLQFIIEIAIIVLACFGYGTPGLTAAAAAGLGYQLAEACDSPELKQAIVETVDTVKDIDEYINPVDTDTVDTVMPGDQTNPTDPNVDTPKVQKEAEIITPVGEGGYICNWNCSDAEQPVLTLQQKNGDSFVDAGKISIASDSSLYKARSDYKEYSVDVKGETAVIKFSQPNDGSDKTEAYTLKRDGENWILSE